MTDTLREALKQIAALEPPAAVPNYRYPQKIARAALAAAPQPDIDADLLGDVEWMASIAAPQPAPEALEGPPHDVLTVALFEAAEGTLTSYQCVKLADKLLARGLRLPGGNETMAWAVVEEGKPLNADWIKAGRRDAELFAGTRDRVVRVAIRVVEGGDDAA